MKRDSRIERWMIAVAMLSAVAPATVRAACPVPGEARATDREAEVSLATATKIATDECSDAAPPATVVSAKVQLENTSDSLQSIECTLQSSKSKDVARVSLPAKYLVTVSLQIANTSGGTGAAPNQASLTCRPLTTAPADTLRAAWTKLTTKALKAVALVQAN